VQIGFAQAPKMKMTTDIPASIIMPDKIKTRIGTLEFFDGFPTVKTVRKAYDFLDLVSLVKIEGENIKDLDSIQQ
jgi:hypothetical protein